MNHDLFDRVVCVNLDRRPDRWKRFQENLTSISWPFKGVERFRAIDGLVAPTPAGWISGPGAWGCLQSHRRILEDALHDNLSSILVLEDDAFFPPEFAEEVGAFLKKVPVDWQCLMLGGQHIKFQERPPVRVGSGVLRCVNCQRTHAYALRGSLIRDLYQRWQSWVPKTTGHCDHVMGPFAAKYKTYSPCDRKGRPKMLVGQAPDRSDIAAGKQTRLVFWDPPNPLAKTHLLTGGGKPDPERLRDRGLHMGYWVDGGTGVDMGLKKMFEKPQASRALILQFRKWWEMLRWEAASMRPACEVAVWLGPYHSEEAEGVVRAVCGPLLVEEASDGGVSGAVGDGAALADAGQKDVKKRRGQAVRRRAGGRGRKR